MTKRLAFSALILLLLAVLFNLGCDSADNPIAPVGTTISISANPTLIGLNGESAALTITGFRPDGNPLNPNTQLTISTSLGVLRATNNFNSASINLVTIGDSGRATAYLFGDGRQGVAAVTVSVTSGMDAAEAMVEVQIGDDASSQPTVAVTANPVNIALNESSLITVTAKNPDQSPLAGADAIVRTSLGSLTPTGGTVTNSDGVVTFTLRSNESGIATVTASVGSSAEETVDVEIGTQASRPTVTLNANPSSVDIGETSTVTVTARDENGNLLGGADAFMTADRGRLSGSNFNSSTGVLRLSGGRGTVSFIAEGPAGEGGEITAFVLNSEVASIPITVRDLPENIGLQVTPTTNLPFPTGSTTLMLAATVTNAEAIRLGDERVDYGAFFVNASGARVELNLNFNPNPAFTTQNGGAAMATVLIVTENLPAALLDLPAEDRRFTIEAAARDDAAGQPVVTMVDITIGGT